MMAIVDVCVTDPHKKNLRGVVFEENKTLSNNEGTPEAQLLAQAIAVAQQFNWNFDDSVYMIIAKGLSLTFYKVKFTKNFIENVKIGLDSSLPIFVDKYPSTIAVSNVEFNLYNERGRKNAAEVLFKISNIIRKRRNS
jgi:hypothetical protein